jgi:hypothetical protein
MAAAAFRELTRTYNLASVQVLPKVICGRLNRLETELLDQRF